jgi:hypothetical protein
MKKLFYSFVFLAFSMPFISRSQTWTSLATDVTGDGTNASLLDGKGLSYYYSALTDSIYFKVDVVKATFPPFGVNIVLRVTGAGNATFWNTTQNNTFAYNRAITAWYATATTGVLGICDATGFSTGNYTNLKMNGVTVYVDTVHEYYILGLLRKDIYNGSGDFDADVIAAVGSNINWNDDIPNSGSGHIHIAATGINNVQEKEQVSVYPNPSNGIFNITADPSIGRYTLTVSNSIGAVVHSEAIENRTGTVKIDLSGFAQGVYLATITSANVQITKEVIIH